MALMYFHIVHPTLHLAGLKWTAMIFFGDALKGAVERDTEAITAGIVHSFSQ